MIQKWIKDQIKPLVPNIDWSIDFVTGDDQTGVVFYEQPSDNADTGDLTIFQTLYTIQVESSNRTDIESWMWVIHDALDKRRQVEITNAGQTYHLIFLRCMTPPGMIGIEERKAIYQIRVEATIKRK